MKVFIHYQENSDPNLHKTLKITLPKSWKYGPTSKLLDQFVETYNKNETLGKENPLDAEKMHLALKRKENNGSYAPKGKDDGGKWVEIASDEITIDTIYDRADVYVLHGPSRTESEIKAEAAEKKAKAEREKANTVQCTRLGCQNRFPRGGPYPNCSYHSAPPVFHETAKFWSCCPHRKAYDFDDFQKIPGCCRGTCTEVKEDEGADKSQFLGGCDVREAAGGGKSELRSIDDFNKSEAAGGSGAAPVLHRLKIVMGEMGVEDELFDQVVDGMKKEIGDLDDVKIRLGEKLKGAFQKMAADQLRIK